MLDFTKYEVGHCPSRPSKPLVKAGGDSAYYYEFAEKMKRYEIECKEYETKLSEWKKLYEKKRAEFKADCLEHFNLTNHPLGERIYSLALEIESNDTFQDIFNNVELIRDKLVL